MIQKLAETITRLSEPEDFLLSGWEVPIPSLPQKILLYPRLFPTLPRVAHHGRFVLILVLETEGTNIVDNVYYRMRPGEGMLIFPFHFHWHSQFFSEELRWLFVTFEMERAEWLLALRDQVFSLSDRALMLARQMCELFLEPSPIPPQRKIQQASLLTALLCELLLNGQRRNEHANEHARAAQTTDLFEKIGQYVISHIDQPTTVTDIAEHVSFSPGHLRRLFHKYFGISISAFIRSYHLIHACHLMQTTDLSLSQIAGRCGFQSAYSFSRAFRRELGQSPSEYRKSQVATETNVAGKLAFDPKINPS